MDMISIIVPCKNRIEDITDCLANIYLAINYARQRIPQLIAEVVVVNDHSDKGFTDSLLRRFGEAIIIDSPGYGPGYARNYGIQKCHGQYLFFTDSDCVVDESWLYSGYCIFMEKKPDIIQGVPWLFQKKDNIEMGNNEEKLYEIMFSKYVTDDSSVMTDSRNLMINKSIIGVLGSEIFSEKIEKATAESRVFGEKCVKKGLHIYFANDVKVYHKDPKNIAEVCHQKYRHGMGRVLIWNKKQDFSYLQARYFSIPINQGIDKNYILPAHTSFLLGFYNSINDLDERAKLIDFLTEVFTYYGVDFGDYQEIQKYLNYE